MTLTKPISLMGHMHICPKVDPGPKPHVGGPVIDAGQSLVTFNGVHVAVEGGKTMCTGMPGPDTMTKGSSLVKINGKGIMRVGDATGHGGKLTVGVPTFRSE
ncbi:PAAR domain-containing protein [uncultured Litoreibacter sp.]|uniref:PAAR domain-containing protein n=1 Tax=uncultured Litoreibacter sp. TaxID=1392394 RepID=UPI002605730F|nr:PAAR domain-containing protein [uncultured Litoreibacter sp.]